jgi:hypothetical protein
MWVNLPQAWMLERRTQVDRTIAAFRGAGDRETMVRLAAEIVRLNRNIAVLREGIERANACEVFILMPQGPYDKVNRSAERKRDRAAKWL